MELKELKEKILNKSLQFNLLIFKYEDDTWLVNQYIDEISKVLGLNINYVADLDTLSNWLHVEDVEYFPVCVGYKLEHTDQIVDEISWYDIDKYQPDYKMFPKWHSYVNDEKLDNFISYIEKFIGVKVKYISIGKNQEDIIELV